MFTLYLLLYFTLNFPITPFVLLEQWCTCLKGKRFAYVDRDEVDIPH